MCNQSWEINNFPLVLKSFTKAAHLKYTCTHSKGFQTLIFKRNKYRLGETTAEKSEKKQQCSLALNNVTESCNKLAERLQLCQALMNTPNGFHCLSSGSGEGFLAAHVYPLHTCKHTHQTATHAASGNNSGGNKVQTESRISVEIYDQATMQHKPTQTHRHTHTAAPNNITKYFHAYIILTQGISKMDYNHHACDNCCCLSD